MSIFSKVKGYRPRKNAFNLEHSITQTQDIGELVPCYIHDDLLPGSREKLSVSTLCRFQAMLAPLQHNVNLYTHFWYVPYRLLDEDFPKFISGELMRDGIDYAPYTITYADLYDAIGLNIIEIGDLSDLQHQSFFGHGSLLEYLGYPAFDDPGSVAPFTGFTQPLNVRRLQAFFLILVERYVNENFKITYKIWNRGDNEVQDRDFVQDARDFAKTKLFLDYDEFMLDVLAGLLTHFLRKYNSHFPPHAWFKDYFTSALPFTQLGEEVSISLSDTAPVKGTVTTAISTDYYLKHTGDGTALDPDYSGKLYNNNGSIQMQGGAVGNQGSLDTLNGISAASDHDLYADLSEATAITINELRIANAIQSLKESFARFGTRYQEWLKGFWNVKASDQSINLPEWLGGNKTSINIAEVDQTSATDNSGVTGASTPQGNLAGKGLGFSSEFVYNRFIEEPGLIIGFCFLQPRAIYPTTGLDRHLLKTNNVYDYFTSKLEHVGEQEVYNAEIYYQDSNALDVFGYQSRYAEYKFLRSQFRGQFADILDFWHLGRKFDEQPSLSNEFLYIDKSTMKRPFAVQQADGIDISNALLWFNFKVHYIAPMSHFGTPSLLN